MPRNKPTHTIDVLGKPDVNPVKVVEEYVESKLNNKYFIKAPNWDSTGDSIEEVYLHARLNYDIQNKLKEELQAHQLIQGRRNENRLRRLQASQAQLRQDFVKVNSFLREFEEKGKIAEKKGVEQLAIHKKLRETNSRIRNVITELEEFRNELKATCDDYEPYERVLNDVVKRLPLVHSVKDLMDRSDALMLAQVEIVSLSNQKVEELDAMRKRLVEISREASLQVLGLKNELTSLDRMYEAARLECFKWERNIGVTKELINEGLCDRERVYDGINQLYRLLCQRRSLYPEIPHEKIEQRLDFIKDEVEVIQEVLDYFERKRLKAEDNPDGSKQKRMC